MTSETRHHLHNGTNWLGRGLAARLLVFGAAACGESNEPMAAPEPLAYSDDDPEPTDKFREVESVPDVVRTTAPAAGPVAINSRLCQCRDSEACS